MSSTTLLAILLLSLLALSISGDRTLISKRRLVKSAALKSSTEDAVAIYQAGIETLLQKTWNSIQYQSFVLHADQAVFSGSTDFKQYLAEDRGLRLAFKITYPATDHANLDPANLWAQTKVFLKKATGALKDVYIRIEVTADSDRADACLTVQNLVSTNNWFIQILLTGQCLTMASVQQYETIGYKACDEHSGMVALPCVHLASYLHELAHGRQWISNTAAIVKIWDTVKGDRNRDWWVNKMPLLAKKVSKYASLKPTTLIEVFAEVESGHALGAMFDKDIEELYLRAFQMDDVGVVIDRESVFDPNTDEDAQGQKFLTSKELDAVFG